MKLIIVRIIKLYQLISSSLIPRHCRFYPTCSHYAIEALNKFGLIKGLWKACIRLLRCTPLSKGGYDPVK